MKFTLPNRQTSVILEDGTVFSMSDLPPPNVERWVKSRKLAILMAIRHQILTEDEACALYALTPEELTSWEKRFKNNF